MRSATTQDEDLSVLTVRMPREQIDQLRVIAKGEYRSLSAEVRRLVEQRITEVDDLEAAA